MAAENHFSVKTSLNDGNRPGKNTFKFKLQNREKSTPSQVNKISNSKTTTTTNSVKQIVNFFESSAVSKPSTTFPKTNRENKAKPNPAANSPMKQAKNKAHPTYSPKTTTTHSAIKKSKLKKSKVVPYNYKKLSDHFTTLSKSEDGPPANPTTSDDLKLKLKLKST